MRKGASHQHLDKQQELAAEAADAADAAATIRSRYLSPGLVQEAQGLWPTDEAQKQIRTLLKSLRQEHQVDSLSKSHTFIQI